MAIIENPAATDGTGVRVQALSIGSPAAASAINVHAAVTDTGAPSVVTTAITNPVTPRVVSATAGGTSTDIKAIQVTIAGTDASGAAITEDLPAFTVNTAGAVTGAKAFATVTSITIPAHDGTGATTSVGTGPTLGLGKHLGRNTVLAAFFGGVKESTAPTVATSATVLASNTVLLDSTLDGSEIIVDLYDS